MCKIMISPEVREQKSIQHCQFQSVTLHISGTVELFFHFFENFDIWVVVGGGGRREGKWSKKWPKMACCAVRTYLSLSKHYLLSIASILLYFKIEKPILCKKL